jgi:tryptophanyl-tRNA synthetase
VADHLGVGIDPDRAVIFTHSQIPELNELLIPFLSLVSVAELGRNPTVKDEIARADGSSTSALMFTYPVHQAADILFCRANLVPVGKDQLPHLELARTIARRFNERYSPDLYFPQPAGFLSKTPLVLGLDGQKMGKSRGNAVALGADDDETARLIRRAKTDAERRITYEPERRPEVANLLQIAALCLNRSPRQIADEIGDRGARALKDLVTDALNAHLRPVRARREEVADDRDYLRSILRAGNERARELAAETLSAVHGLMHADYSPTALPHPGGRAPSSAPGVLGPTNLQRRGRCRWSVGRWARGGSGERDVPPNRPALRLDDDDAAGEGPEPRAPRSHPGPDPPDRRGGHVPRRARQRASRAAGSAR